MRATVINAPGEIVLKEVADPQIQFPGDAVVRIVAACVCGSDLWRYRGIEGFEPGSRIGHEAVGVVESVGDAVSQVAPGDFVIVAMYNSCGDPGSPGISKAVQFCSSCSKPRLWRKSWAASSDAGNSKVWASSTNRST